MVLLQRQKVDSWRGMQVRRMDLDLRTILLLFLKKPGRVYAHMKMDQCNYRIYKREISARILSRYTVYVLYRIELLSINREKVSFIII